MNTTQILNDYKTLIDANDHIIHREMNTNLMSWAMFVIIIILAYGFTLLYLIDNSKNSIKKNCLLLSFIILSPISGIISMAAMAFMIHCVTWSVRDINSPEGNQVIESINVSYNNVYDVINPQKNSYLTKLIGRPEYKLDERDMKNFYINKYMELHKTNNASDDAKMKNDLESLLQ